MRLSLRAFAIVMVCVYAACFLALATVGLMRDRAIRSNAPAQAEPLFLGSSADWRVDHGSFPDAAGLLASLDQDPFSQSTGQRPNVGLLTFEGGFLWLRVQLPDLEASAAGGRDWTLWVDDRFARAARLILVRGATVATHDWRYGDPAATGLALKALPVFHLEAADLSGAMAYLAFSSYGGLKGDLYLAGRPVFEQGFTRRLVQFNFLNGAVGALAIYLGAIGLRLREKAMVYAAGMAFFMMIRNFAETGVHHSVLLPGNPILADVLLYATQPVGMAFWLLFTLSFVGLAERAPRLDRFLKLVAVLIPIQGLLVCLKGGFWPEMPFNTSAALPTFIGMICGLGSTIWLAASGNRRAFYFLLCWLPLAVGLALRMTTYLVPSWNPDLGILSRLGADLTVSLLALAILLTVDLRQRERRLTRIAERNEQRARDYAEIGTDGVFEAGPDGLVRSAAGPLARTLDLVPGRSFAAALEGIPPELAEAAASMPLKGREFTVAETAGLRWISLSSVPIRDEEGRPDGFRAVVVDITSSVSEREIEQRRNTLAALGHLAGGIAHEVNNLLHPIISLTRRVSERHVEDRDGKRLLDLVVASGVRAGEIVKSVLKAYTPEGFAGAPVALDRAVRDAVDTVRSTLPPSCRLEARIDVLIRPQVRIGEMIQVISNLTNNSMRATGGNCHLQITLRSANEGAVLEVTDDGPGIPAGLLERLAQPFVTGSAGGIGLGLSMVRRIANGWNADFQVESGEGKGTTIRLVFHDAMPQAAETEKGADAAPAPMAVNQVGVRAKVENSA